MKYYEIELNGRTVKFRLTSSDCITIENQSKKSISEFLGELSMTTVITILRYMVRSSDHNFDMTDASNLYDELIDAGYTLETIVSDIIMEALVVSGFMKKDDLKDVKEVKSKIKKEVVEDLMKK